MAKERIIYDNYDVCTMFNDAHTVYGCRKREG